MKPHKKNDLAKKPRKPRKPKHSNRMPRKPRKPTLHGLGYSTNDAMVDAKRAADWAAPRIKAGADWAAPRLKSAADEALVLTKRGIKAADPHVRSALKQVPRQVWIGAGVVALLGTAWFLWDNRDRNPQTSKADFVAKLWTALGTTTLSSSAKKLIIAQFALESGWGYARASVKGFNYGNITAGAGKWTGPITYGQDKHCVAGGAICIPIIQKFRKYGSNEEAIADYLAFLGGTSRYARSYQALLGGNLVNFATQLREDGYYTASVDVYVSGMQGAMSIIEKYAG